MNGLGVTPDPYLVAPRTLSVPRVVDKTIRSPRLNAGENTAVIVGAGQSNIANQVVGSGELYTPTNASKVDNFNINNGGTYAAVDPLLGTDGINGSFLGRLADKLITAGIFARIILVPVGYSATSITRWVPSGDLHANLLVAGRRLASVGLTPTMWLWQQGESDNGSMSRNTYATNLSSMIAGVRSAGYSQPWFLAKSTFNGTTTDANIQAAYGDVINGTDIFAGADTDTITSSTYRQTAPSPHFNPTGAGAAADLWKTAIDVVF